MRQYRPSGDLLATVLAGRVDALEQQLAQNSGDVTALGRGVADLTTEIRKLTTSGNSASGQTPTPDDDEEEGEVPAGQPDWFAVEDPDDATRVLTALTTWVDEIGVHHGIRLPVACWALHPDVVAVLLALVTERESAYIGEQPTPVSEWLTRWLPATTTAITSALAACDEARAHVEAGTAYDLTGFDPISAGSWWALDRTIPAPAAFALPALT